MDRVVIAVETSSTGRARRVAGRCGDEGDRVVEIGDEPAWRSPHRRRWVRGRARLRRHPHPLRRPGVLGPRAHAILLSRRDHRGGRQLRVSHRADPARPPRADRPHDGEGRGHEPRLPPGGRPLGLRAFPEYLDVGLSARHRPELRRPTSATRRCASTCMGDDAAERAATADEISAMVAIVDEAMAAGAAGFATSIAATHRGCRRPSDPQPRRGADRARGARPGRRARRAKV